MTSLRIKLKDILNDIYNIELNYYADKNNYSFGSRTISEQDLAQFKDFIKANDINYDTSKETDYNLKLATNLAMLLRFESSYVRDTVKLIKEIMVEQIKNDFSHLNQTVTRNDIQFKINENTPSIQEQETIMSQDFTIEYDKESEEVVFAGSMEKLAYCIISTIHRFGAFRYEGLHEFYISDNDNEIQDRKLKTSIGVHLFWLKQWNSIHADGHFEYREHKLLDSIDKSNLGDYNYTVNDVITALDSLWLDS